MNLKSERKRVKKLDFQINERRMLDAYELHFKSSGSDIFLFDTPSKELAFAAELIANTYRVGEGRYEVSVNTDTDRYIVCPKEWVSEVDVDVDSLEKTGTEAILKVKEHLPKTKIRIDERMRIIFF